MSIIEPAERALARRDANGPKVAVLFLIHGAGLFALTALGVEDLASPWMWTALAPAALIYAAERQGKINWFRGMSLPTLCLMAVSIALVWVLNTPVAVPVALAYCVLAGWISAFGFLLFRVWTFDPAAHAMD